VGAGPKRRVVSLPALRALLTALPESHRRGTKVTRR
jgi:hypothetical protein